MKTALLLFLLITMTPQAREAFGEIAQARIVYGTMDIQGTETEIEAVGWKDGVLMQIECLWRGGLPVFINYKQVAIIS